MEIKHNLGDIIGIVLFASLGNANDWHEIEAFAKAHEKTLKKYFKLENGIPSHDTIKMSNEHYFTEKSAAITAAMARNGQQQ